MSTAAPHRVTGTGPAAVHPDIVEVPMRSFLAVDGQGSPDAVDHRQAVIALQKVSEATRAVLEHRGRPVHDVLPLETLWTAPGDSPGEAWQWTVLIEQPATVTGDIVVVSRIKAARSVPGVVLARLRWWHWREGRSAELMHAGPFLADAVARARLDDFIRASGGRPRGRYHELQLAGPQSADPARRWSVLRRQIAPGGGPSGS